MRNVPRSPSFTARFEALADLPIGDLTRAAIECRDADDFLQRLDTLARR